MAQTAQPARIPLTYQGATFRRSLIYLIIAVMAFLTVRFIKFPREIPPPGANYVEGPSLPVIGLGTAVVILLIFSIMDALFVLDYKYFSKKIAYDEDNLYVDKKSQEVIIPLSDITAISLASSRINNSVRGTYYDYLVDYIDGDRDKDITITVYAQTRPAFTRFTELVQQKNPSVKIKSWSTSFDGLIRLFRKKR